MTKYRQKRLESRRRRFARVLRRIFSRGYVKQQRAYRVDIGRATLKRLVVEDSRIARRIECNLRAFDDIATVPGVVSCFADEVWVEFVEGAEVTPTDEPAIAALAQMFATVSARSPRRRDPRELGLDRELRENLHFLEQAGVLAADVCSDLAGAVDALTPETLWIGYDYTDPRPSNFLWNKTNELLIVDVESLVGDSVVGCGAAKALVAWMAPHRAAFLAELEKRCEPDFLRDFPFIELYFLARWHKRSVLHRKPWLIQPALFDRFRHIAPPGGAR